MLDAFAVSDPYAGFLLPLSAWSLKVILHPRCYYGLVAGDDISLMCSNSAYEFMS